jgi:hypothetical protein
MMDKEVLPTSTGSEKANGRDGEGKSGLKNN